MHLRAVHTTLVCCALVSLHSALDKINEPESIVQAEVNLLLTPLRFVQGHSFTLLVVISNSS